MDERRVLLVEDEDTTRDRLARVISSYPGLSLAGAARSYAEGRTQLEELRPDVLLTDLDLGDGSGIDLLLAVGELGLDCLSMVITIFGDERHVVAALQAGALGYLLKDGSPEYIGRSIEELLAGGSPISPPIARYRLRRFHPQPTGAQADEGERPKLSEREREVLQHIIKGFSYAEIAQLLEISTHTVGSHIRHIYRKLEVSSRGEAVYEAVQLGLVKLSE